MDDLLFIILVFLLIVAVVLFIRNNWVYDKRYTLMYSDYTTYCKLHSYNYMMYHFWIWDVGRFIKGGQEITNKDYILTGLAFVSAIVVITINVT